MLFGKWAPNRTIESAINTTASMANATSDVEQDSGDVDPRRKRSCPEPLEHAALTPDDEDDREPRERGRGDAVPEHPGEEVVGRAVALDPVVAAVDRPEQHEEDDRQKQ